MMLILVALSVAMSVGLLVFLVAQAVPDASRPVRKRLVEMGLDDVSVVARRKRAARREGLEVFIQTLGEQLQQRYGNASETRRFLMRAGYRSASAPGLYWGIRTVMTVGLGFFFWMLAMLAGSTGPVVLLATFYGAAMGLVVPVFLVRARMKRRQKELQLALPDALDLLVVCVEAGLGLNQALMRVAMEARHFSELMTEELTLVNLEIRAGTPRDEALMNLAERTGVEDVRALAVMLIQTDRFGTSIAKSLRVHSNTLRQKRRQRAEEAAAKTAIKMVFPLVFCIFPALFVVIIGSGLIQIFTTLGSIG